MTTDMHWKSEAAFEADLGSADEQRLRAIRAWALHGETKTAAMGRNSSPSARRGWKARREAVEAKMRELGLDW